MFSTKIEGTHLFNYEILTNEIKEQFDKVDSKMEVMNIKYVFPSLREQTQKPFSGNFTIAIGPK